MAMNCTDITEKMCIKMRAKKFCRCDDCILPHHTQCGLCPIFGCPAYTLKEEDDGDCPDCEHEEYCEGGCEIKISGKRANFKSKVKTELI